MADLVFVALTIGFFVLMVGLVRLCDHVIGPDPIETGSATTGRPDGADAPSTPARDHVAVGS
jgi:hypothetical protein